MESSLIPSKGNVSQPSNDEATPVQLPENSCSIAMPESHQASVEPASVSDAAGRKWTTLIGTPSKPPVPDNILVPDPSPAQTFSDSGCSTSGPLTPESFIHRRRQGEYVPRPPVWTMQNVDGSFSISSDPPALMDTAMNRSSEITPLELKYAPIRKQGNRRPAMHTFCLADVKLPGIPNKHTDDVFVDEPLVVYMMQRTNLPAPEQPDSRPVSTSTGASSCNLSSIVVPPDRTPTGSSAEAVSATDPPLAAFNPMEIHKEGDAPGNRTSFVSTACASTQASSTGAASYSMAAHPVYSMIEGPGRSGERLSRYADLRFQPPPGGSSDPLANVMLVGSVVIFVGRTTLEDNTTGKLSDFELHLNKRYIIAEMYGDYWALLLKLEPGLRLGECEPTTFLGRKSKPKAPQRRRDKVTFIGLRTDPKFVVYAPLCAFTLETNPEAPPSQPPSNSNGPGPSVRGLAQATHRTYSLEAEAEAIKDKWTFVPKREVYYKYVDIMQSKGFIRNDLLPVGEENINPSIRMRADGPVVSRKPIKTTPKQSIKDFFKLGTNVGDISNKENIEPNQHPHSQPVYCFGTEPPGSNVAASAPQLDLPTLPGSLEDLSARSPKSSSDDPIGYSRPDKQKGKAAQQEEDANQQQDNSSQKESNANEKRSEPTQQKSTIRENQSGPTQQQSGANQAIGATPLRQYQKIPVGMRAASSSGNESKCPDAGSSTGRRGEWVELAPPVPSVGRVQIRTASDPTPRPKHTSPLTMPPSHVPVDDIAEGSPSLKGNKKAEKSTLSRNAGEALRNIKNIPAAIENYCRPSAKRPVSNNRNSSIRKRIIEPCKNAARTLTGRKRSFVPQRRGGQRQSILPPHTYQPPPSTSGPIPVQSQQKHRIIDNVIEDTEEQRALRQRLVVAEPLATTWSSGSSGAGDKLAENNGDASDGASSDQNQQKHRITDNVIEDTEEQRALRQRLAAATPLATTWDDGDQSGQDQSNANNMDEESSSRTVKRYSNAGEGSSSGVVKRYSNAGEGSSSGAIKRCSHGFSSSADANSEDIVDTASDADGLGRSDSPTLVRPGHLLDHLFAATREETIRERLAVTPEQLVLKQQNGWTR